MVHKPPLVMPRRDRQARSRSPLRPAPAALCGRCSRSLEGPGHCLPVEGGALLSVCITCYLVQDLDTLQRALPRGTELCVVTDGLQILWETARAAVEAEAARLLPQ